MTTVLFIFISVGVIAYILVFAYRMYLDEQHVQRRIKSETHQRKQKTQAVLERRTETVTETVRIELVPNEELSLGLTNLTDATNHLGTVIETTAQILPLSIEKPMGNEMSQSVPNSSQTPLKQVSQVSQPEQLVQACFEKYGNPSIRDIEEETGLSRGTIGRTNAWKNRPKS